MRLLRAVGVIEIPRGDDIESSFELGWDAMVSAVECCDSAIEVTEPILSFRNGGGSLSKTLSLPLPLPLEVPFIIVPPGAAVLLVLLPLRSFNRFDTSLAIPASLLAERQL